jgi:diacylglycerol kinase family enzyme
VFHSKIPEGTTLRVYAVGGDGILFDCLNGIMGLENTELAAIPYGRTNNFIRGFGKHNEVFFRNIALQYNAPKLSMDVIRCNGIYALNHCLIGPEAEVVLFSRKLRKNMEQGGPLSRWLCKRLYTLFYIISSFFIFAKKELMNQMYEMDTEVEVFSDVYQGLHIYNAPYRNGGLLNPVSNAMPNDGILNLLGIRRQGILQIFSLYPINILNNQNFFSKLFIFKYIRKINVRSKDILRVILDSIIFYEPELEIEILPGAVQFIDATWRGYKGASGAQN